MSHFVSFLWTVNVLGEIKTRLIEKLDELSKCLDLNMLVQRHCTKGQFLFTKPFAEMRVIMVMLEKNNLKK